MPAAINAARPKCGRTVPVENGAPRCRECAGGPAPKGGLYLPKDELNLWVTPEKNSRPKPAALDPAREAQLNSLYAFGALAAAGVILAGMFVGKLGLEIANGFAGALGGTLAGMILGYLGAKFDTLFPMWMRRWGPIFMLFSATDEDYVKIMTVFGVIGGILSGFLIGLQLELSLWVALPLGALGAGLLFGLVGSMATRFLVELRRADEEYERRRRGGC
jgi:hypothetical protein